MRYSLRAINITGKHFITSTSHIDKIQTLEVIWQGNSRNAAVYVPASIIKPSPVVLMLHGAGGDAAKAIQQTGWCDVADQEGFIAVFPNGLPVDPSRKSSFLRNPQVWNSGVERGLLNIPEVDDVGYIDALLSKLSALFALNEREIFAAGFSNGGGMCWRLALELSHRFAAIAPVCSYISVPEPWAQSNLVSAVVINCLDDPFIPLEGGMVKDIWTRAEISRPSVVQNVLNFAASADCRLTGEEKLTSDVLRRSYGPGARKTMVEFYTIANAGHAWPGGPPLLSERIAGKPTNAIDATAVIWQFFQSIRQNRENLL